MHRRTKGHKGPENNYCAPNQPTNSPDITTVSTSYVFIKVGTEGKNLFNEN